MLSPAKTALITLTVAMRALSLDIGNQPSACPRLQVVASSIDPGAGRRNRSLKFRDNRSLRVRAVNADNSLSFNHFQRECAIIPSAVRSKELLPIRGAVRQNSLFFLYSGAKELRHKFFDLLHESRVHRATRWPMIQIRRGGARGSQASKSANRLVRHYAHVMNPTCFNVFWSNTKARMCPRPTLSPFSPIDGYSHFTVTIQIGLPSKVD